MTEIAGFPAFGRTILGRRSRLFFVLVIFSIAFQILEKTGLRLGWDVIHTQVEAKRRVRPAIGP